MMIRLVTAVQTIWPCRHVELRPGEGTGPDQPTDNPPGWMMGQQNVRDSDHVGQRNIDGRARHTPHGQGIFRDVGVERPAAATGAAQWMRMYSGQQ